MVSTSAQWEMSKWGANVCFVTATLFMLSPTLAAESVWPWILYLLGNSVWLADSYKQRNMPWVYLSLFFCIWDLLLIYTRIAKIEVLVYIEPIIKTMENLL